MVSKFVHLRVHTAYSLSESTLGISKLAELAQNDGQPAMAITDSQNLFGGYEFSKTMAQSGIQPIIGASIFLNDENGDGEVALLAQNEIGYKNLSKLMSDAWMRCGGSEKPKVKVGEFLTSSEGLILLTGGPKDGFISRVVLQTPAIALARLRMLSDNLQGRVYVELQRHG
ncbi:MAG: PHP domain-containing protein, partial [Alphaproteobacteria bacterium]